MRIDKKQWFPVSDSLTKTADGEDTFRNVEARFSDHPVINVEKSRAARCNVYEFSIVLHTRVLKVGGDLPAIRNVTSQPLRFDKGEVLGQDDFDIAKKLIARCPEAWNHYQQFREAPVTELEARALQQLGQAPALKGKVLVDVGGKLMERKLDDEEPKDDFDGDEEDEGAEEAIEQPAQLAVQPARAKKATQKLPK